MENEKPKGFVPPAPPIEQLEIFPIESKKNGTFQRLKDKVKTKNSNSKLFWSSRKNGVQMRLKLAKVMFLTEL